MRKKGNLLFLGLPQSGKSTFIAALWHIVESNELDNSLRITSSLPGEREYLKKIRTAWLSQKKLTRNVGEFKSEVSLNVSTKSGISSELLFPDLAGEIFESHFSHRMMKQDFVDKLNMTSNIVLFINPDKLKLPTLISVADFLKKDSQETSTKNESEKVEGTIKEQSANDQKTALKIEVDWDHKFAPTQVVLVDLLQIILEYIENPKIAIVISAWDVILNLPASENKKKNPLQWLKSDLPLFHQYLHSNQDLFQFKIYGISAQGGDYKTDRTKLAEHIIPSHRIIVQTDGINPTNDISLPIKWLLDAEE